MNKKTELLREGGRQKGIDCTVIGDPTIGSSVVRMFLCKSRSESGPELIPPNPLIGKPGPRITEKSKIGKGRCKK